MLGSIIGGAMKIGGAIMGGAAQRRAATKQRQIIETQKKDNEAWYNQRYDEDSTQRADAQRAIQMARDTMKKRYNQAQASGVVAGATDESIAAQKAATNRVLSSTAGNIAAVGDSRKDAIEQQYLGTKANLSNQEIETWKQQGQAVGNATQGVASAAAGVTENLGLDGLFDKKTAR